MSEPNFETIIEQLKKFRDERDWEQFHNSKDLAIAISTEASELFELFLWKGNEDVDNQKLRDELADIFFFCLLLANKHGLNVQEIIQDKINKNAIKIWSCYISTDRKLSENT